MPILENKQGQTNADSLFLFENSNDIIIQRFQFTFLDDSKIEFKPIWETVDFKNKHLLLNEPSAPDEARSSKDTLDVGSGTQYVSASHSDKMIKK